MHANLNRDGQNEATAAISPAQFTFYRGRETVRGTKVTTLDLDSLDLYSRVTLRLDASGETVPLDAVLRRLDSNEE